MSWMETDRRATKQHQCQGRQHGSCAYTINRGDWYQISALPPNGEMGNTAWWHMKLCAPCAAYYGHPIAAVAVG